MNETMKIIIQCILLILAVEIIGVFWFEVFATIFNRTFAEKLTDKEIEEKTK